MDDRRRASLRSEDKRAIFRLLAMFGKSSIRCEIFENVD
jgi:hypothetical protein